MKLLIAGITGLLLLNHCAAQDEPFKRVSIINLIAQAADLHGKVIEATGYLWTGTHGVCVLFLHEDDYKHVIMKNAVFLDLADAQWSKARELNSKYVTVQGVFNAKHEKISKFYSGLIERITDMSFYSDPARPRALYIGSEPYTRVLKE